MSLKAGHGTENTMVQNATVIALCNVRRGLVWLLELRHCNLVHFQTIHDTPQGGSINAQQL